MRSVDKINFSYNNFLSNLDSDITGGGGGPGGGGTIGIATLMNARTTYLLENSLFTAIAPIISDISLSADNPVVGDMITISTSITDGNSAYIGYRINEFAPFTKVEMVSDGSGIFQVTIPVKAAYTEYYIYSENDNAGKFSPQRAEHEFYNFTATSVNTSVGDVVINEFMASNDMTQVDQDFEYDDWIELYNRSSSPVNIGGWFLSDDGSDLAKYRIPLDTVLPANGYLTFFEDTNFGPESSDPNRITGFGLSDNGETVHLTSAINDVLTDYRFKENFGASLEGTTLGYYYKPGSGTYNFIALQDPTPAAPNAAPKSGPSSFLR